MYLVSTYLLCCASTHIYCRGGGGHGPGHGHPDGGAVLQEEARPGGDLPSVGQRPRPGHHVQLPQARHQGGRVEAGDTGAAAD